jgi:hypothetical protein
VHIGNETNVRTLNASRHQQFGRLLGASAIIEE